MFEIKIGCILNQISEQKLFNTKYGNVMIYGPKSFFPDKSDIVFAEKYGTNREWHHKALCPLLSTKTYGISGEIILSAYVKFNFTYWYREH